MPVKYVREKGGAPRETRSYDPPSLFGAVAGVDLKRRIFLIYIGIGAVVLGLAFMNARDRSDTFDGQKVLRGVGVVISRQGGVLVLEVAGRQAEYRPEPEILGRLDPGDRVAVLYQHSRQGRQVRVVEIGAVPIGP